VGLGGDYCNMGRRLRQNGAAQAALPWFDKAQARLEEVRRRDRANGTANTYLRNTHWNRAEALLELGRDADALAEWHRALKFPASEGDRTSLQAGRALAQARLGSYEEAAAFAEGLAGRQGANDFSTYRAARILSLASAAAGRDGKRPEPERRQLAERYAGGAVALLRRLQSQGYFKNPSNLADLEKDKDLGPLRQRPDFQKLLGEIGKKP
jgi:hypothetical protein